MFFVYLLILCNANQTIQLVHPLTPTLFVLGNTTYKEIVIDLDLELFRGNLPQDHLVFQLWLQSYCIKYPLTLLQIQKDTIQVTVSLQPQTFVLNLNQELQSTIDFLHESTWTFLTLSYSNERLVLVVKNKYQYKHALIQSENNLQNLYNGQLKLGSHFQGWMIDIAILDGDFIDDASKFLTLYSQRSDCTQNFKYTPRCGEYLQLIAKPYYSNRYEYSSNRIYYQQIAINFSQLFSSKEYFMTGYFKAKSQNTNWIVDIHAQSNYIWTYYDQSQKKFKSSNYCNYQSTQIEGEWLLYGFGITQNSMYILVLDQLESTSQYQIIQICQNTNAFGSIDRLVVNHASTSNLSDIIIFNRIPTIEEILERKTQFSGQQVQNGNYLYSEPWVECDPGYFLKYGQCFECNPSCETCSGPLQTNCLSCHKDYIFSNESSSCLVQCPWWQLFSQSQGCQGVYYSIYLKFNQDQNENSYFLESGGQILNEITQNFGAILQKDQKVNITNENYQSPVLPQDFCIQFKIFDKDGQFSFKITADDEEVLLISIGKSILLQAQYQQRPYQSYNLPIFSISNSWYKINFCYYTSNRKITLELNNQFILERLVQLNLDYTKTISHSFTNEGSDYQAYLDQFIYYIPGQEIQSIALPESYCKECLDCGQASCIPVCNVPQESCLYCQTTKDLCYEYSCSILQGFSPDFKVLLEDIPEYIKEQAQSQCIELCGDGLHMGQFQCDDGNNFNEDGCSSNCQLEEGADCQVELYKRTVCFTNNYKKPQAIYKGSIENIINIEIQLFQYIDQNENFKGIVGLQIDETIIKNYEVVYNTDKFTLLILFESISLEDADIYIVFAYNLAEEQSYFQLNLQIFPKCIHYSQLCLECIADYQLINNNCLCTDNSIITEELQCIKCKENYLAYNNECVCPNGFYIDQGQNCNKCQANCIECKLIQDELQCNKCDDGLMFINQICLSCNQIEGYGVGWVYSLNSFDEQIQKLLKSYCIEICGDGLDLGFYECDDGNQTNQDGCDSNCQKEKGFKCNEKGCSNKKLQVAFEYVGLKQNLYELKIASDQRVYVDQTLVKEFEVEIQDAVFDIE